MSSNLQVIMVNRLPRRGLYAITASELISSDGLISAVEGAIKGGVALIQYRDKRAPYNHRQKQAAALCQLCHRWSVPLIVNDDPYLAREVGADGVHLGQHDATYEQARAILGPEAIIGMSCYNSLDKALLAQAIGANYVAFGRFFPSKTKPESVQATLSLAQKARRRLSISIVAIGGITPQNGNLLIDAGADLLAVIDGVFGQADPQDAARRYAQLFHTTSKRLFKNVVSAGRTRRERAKKRSLQRSK